MRGSHVSCLLGLPLLLFQSGELGCFGDKELGECFYDNLSVVTLLPQRKSSFLNEKLSTIITSSSICSRQSTLQCKHPIPPQAWIETMGIRAATLDLVAEHMADSGLPAAILAPVGSSAARGRPAPMAATLVGPEAEQTRKWLVKFWDLVDRAYTSDSKNENPNRQSEAPRPAAEPRTDGVHFFRTILHPFEQYRLLPCVRLLPLHSDAGDSCRGSNEDVGQTARGAASAHQKKPNPKDYKVKAEPEPLHLLSPLALLPPVPYGRDGPPIPLALRLRDDTVDKDLGPLLDQLGVPVLHPLVETRFPKCVSDLATYVGSYGDNNICTVLRALCAACLARGESPQGLLDRSPISLRLDLLCWLCRAQPDLHLSLSKLTKREQKDPSEVSQRSEAQATLRAMALFPLWHTTGQPLDQLDTESFVPLRSDIVALNLQPKSVAVIKRPASSAAPAVGQLQQEPLSLGSWKHRVVMASLVDQNLCALLSTMQIDVLTWPEFYLRNIVPRLTDLHPDERYMHVRNFIHLHEHNQSDWEEQFHLGFDTQHKRTSPADLLDALRSAAFIPCVDGSRTAHKPAAHFFDHTNALFCQLLSKDHFVPPEVPRDPEFTRALKVLNLVKDLTSARALEICISAFDAKYAGLRQQAELPADVRVAGWTLLHALTTFIAFSPSKFSADSAASITTGTDQHSPSKSSKGQPAFDQQQQQQQQAKENLRFLERWSRCSFVITTPPPAWAVEARALLAGHTATVPIMPAILTAPRRAIATPREVVRVPDFHSDGVHADDVACFTWSQMASVEPTFTPCPAPLGADPASPQHYPMSRLPAMQDNLIELQGFTLFRRNAAGFAAVVRHTRAVVQCYQALRAAHSSGLGPTYSVGSSGVQGDSDTRSTHRARLDALAKTVFDDLERIFEFLNHRESHKYFEYDADGPGTVAELRQAAIFPVDCQDGSVALACANTLFFERLPTDQQPVSMEFPGLYYVPTNLRKFENLLRQLGGQERPGPPQLVQVTRTIAELFPDTVPPKMVRVVDAVLCCLAAMVARGPDLASSSVAPAIAHAVKQSASSDAQQDGVGPELAGLMLPDYRLHMRSAADLIIDDLFATRAIELPGLPLNIRTNLAAPSVYDSVAGRGRAGTLSHFLQLSGGRVLSSLVEERRPGSMITLRCPPTVSDAFEMLLNALCSTELGESVQRLLHASASDPLTSHVVQQATSLLPQLRFRLVTAGSARNAWYLQGTDTLVSAPPTVEVAAPAGVSALLACEAMISTNQHGNPEVLVSGLDGTIARGEVLTTIAAELAPPLAEVLGRLAGVSLAAHVGTLGQLLLTPPSSMATLLAKRQVASLTRLPEEDGEAVHVQHHTQLWDSLLASSDQPFVAGETVGCTPGHDTGAGPGLIYATVVEDLGPQSPDGFRRVRVRVGAPDHVVVSAAHLFRFPPSQSSDKAHGQAAHTPGDDGATPRDAKSSSTSSTADARQGVPSEHGKLVAMLRRVLMMPEADQRAAFRRLFVDRHPDLIRVGDRKVSGQETRDLFRLVNETMKAGAIPAWAGDGTGSNGAANPAASAPGPIPSRGLDWERFASCCSAIGSSYARRQNLGHGGGRSLSLLIGRQPQARGNASGCDAAALSQTSGLTAQARAKVEWTREFARSHGARPPSWP